MSENVYLMTIFMVAGTILLIFGVRYWSLARQASAKAAGDVAYRAVAEKAVATQAETGAALTAMQATLADIVTRLTTVEKVLKDVG